MLRFFIFFTIQAGTNFGLLLAQAAATAPADLGGWMVGLNIGLAGIGLIAFVKRWIVAGKELEEAKAREAAKDAEIQALRKVIDEKVIPELVKSRETGDKMIGLTEDFLDLVRNYQRMSAHQQSPGTGS